MRVSLAPAADALQFRLRATLTASQAKFAFALDPAADRPSESRW
jgi:hypothetical protein